MFLEPVWVVSCSPVQVTVWQLGERLLVHLKNAAVWSRRWIAAFCWLLLLLSSG